MIATGTLVEVGQLEDEADALGIVIKRPDGTLITIKGLTEGETRVAVALLFQRVTVVLTAGAPP